MCACEGVPQRESLELCPSHFHFPPHGSVLHVAAADRWCRQSCTLVTGHCFVVFGGLFTEASPPPTPWPGATTNQGQLTVGSVCGVGGRNRGNARGQDAALPLSPGNNRRAARLAGRRTGRGKDRGMGRRKGSRVRRDRGGWAGLVGQAMARRRPTLATDPMLPLRPLLTANFGSYRPAFKEVLHQPR